MSKLRDFCKILNSPSLHPFANYHRNCHYKCYQNNSHSAEDELVLLCDSEPWNTSYFLFSADGTAAALFSLFPSGRLCGNAVFTKGMSRWLTVVAADVAILITGVIEGVFYVISQTSADVTGGIARVVICMGNVSSFMAASVADFVAAATVNVSQILPYFAAMIAVGIAAVGVLVSVSCSNKIAVIAPCVAGVIIGVRNVISLEAAFVTEGIAGVVENMLSHHSFKATFIAEAIASVAILMVGYRSYRAALITGGIASVPVDVILYLSLMLTEVADPVTVIIIKMRNCPRVSTELANGIAIACIGVFYIRIFTSADATF